MKSRNAKLRAQMPKAESKLFEGVVICISGPTGKSIRGEGDFDGG